jgi:hypothetical protein
MFGPVKEALRERRFSSDEEVTGTVQNWSKKQPKKENLSDGTKKPAKRRNRPKSREITPKNNTSLASA